MLCLLHVDVVLSNLHQTEYDEHRSGYLAIKKLQRRSRRETQLFRHRPLIFKFNTSRSRQIKLQTNVLLSMFEQGHYVFHLKSFPMTARMSPDESQVTSVGGKSLSFTSFPTMMCVLRFSIYERLSSIDH